MKVWVAATASVAMLGFPATAAAHGRGPTVALDDRLRVDSVPPGVRARVLNGDRGLLLTARGALVLGYLGEPFLRFRTDGVWANRASPTAVADRVVVAGRGWERVAPGPSFAWHDHRLAPPRTARAGLAGRWRVPVRVGGRVAAVAGTFVRVKRPALLAWAAAALVAAAIIVAAARLAPARRRSLVVALAAAAVGAALAAVAGFAVRDAPSGRIAWTQVGGGAVVAVACVGLLVSLDGGRRVAAASVIGAVAAATTLRALPIYWHGVVIAALSANVMRALVAVAIVAGAAAAILGLTSTDEAAA